MKVAVIQVQANNLSEHRQAWERLESMVQDAATSHDLVLVPECAFPAYFIHPDEGDVGQIVAEGESLLARIKCIARQHETYIAYGYVEKDGNALFNTALLIDRKGNEVAKKRKSFLWHFDSQWFTEGKDLAVADTDFGKVGLVVCADARMPEIVRLAAIDGAKLIIDLANLTATGPDISALQNAQSTYMLSIRALENQVWLAVSDKWGVEADSITYAGRSGVFAPDGSCVFQASSDKDEIVSVDIPTDEKGKIVCPGSISVIRRPELYEPLTWDKESLPVARMLREPVIPAEVTPYVTVAAGEIQSAEKYLQMIRRFVHQGSGIICMPPVSISLSEMAETIARLLPRGVVTAATELNENGLMTTYMITSQGIERTFRTLHSEEAQDSKDYPIFQTQWGNIGIMHDKEALLPEWPRTLMLLGADCLLWPNRLPHTIAFNVGRTRAAENRIYVVSAQSGNEGGISQIIDPNGTVAASTLQNRTIHACGTLALFAASRVKTIVPGTNVVANRHPQSYGGILK